MGAIKKDNEISKRNRERITSGFTKDREDRAACEPRRCVSKMKRIITIILTIFFVSCLNHKQDPIERFWNWFIKNKDELHKINDTKRDEILNKILSQLKKVQPELSIEISREENGIREMTISPEGDRDKFEIVKLIVQKAPTIKGWKIIAFRQQIGFDFTLEYQDIRLTPSELYFIPIRDQESLDIIIYGKGFNKYDFNTLAHYGLIMMDNVLGEYDCVTKIRHYDFRDISELLDTGDLIPLTEIRSYIE